MDVEDTGPGISDEDQKRLFKHFIWMDRRLPVTDGMEATRRIRDLPDGKGVKIVIVTASVFAEQQCGEMLDAGMDDYVRKPYEAGEIYAALSKHLGVKYLYQDTPEKPAGEVILSPEMMGVLPVKLRNDLTEALELLDSERIDAVIQQVAMHDQPLQSNLKKPAENFDYPAILRVLQKRG